MKDFHRDRFFREDNCENIIWRNKCLIIKTIYYDGDM